MAAGRAEVKSNLGDKPVLLAAYDKLVKSAQVKDDHRVVTRHQHARRIGGDMTEAGPTDGQDGRCRRRVSSARRGCDQHGSAQA